MKIRLAAPLQSDSIVDGEGIRTVIWTQGCIHNCKGCHNKMTHDLDGGFLLDVEELKEELKNTEFQDGITLSGGDPFMQVEACLEIAEYSKKIGLNVWTYTGYTFEQLLILSKKNPKIINLLQNIDVLIDGKFVLKERSFDVKFRGSKNQRIIDVKESLKNNKAVTVKKYDEEQQSYLIKGEYLFI